MVKLFRHFFSGTTFWLYISLTALLILLPLGNGALNNITILQLRGDYFFHILMFLPWAFFRKAEAPKSTPQTRTPAAHSLIPPFSHSIIWLLFGLLFAAGSEALQYLLPYRAYNVNDLIANMLGVLLGFTLLFLINIRKRG